MTQERGRLHKACMFDNERQCPARTVYDLSFETLIQYCQICPTREKMLSNKPQ